MAGRIRYGTPGVWDAPEGTIAGCEEHGGLLWWNVPQAACAALSVALLLLRDYATDVIQQCNMGFVM